LGKKEKIELEELKKKYQLLLLYNSQILRICLQHTGMSSAIDYKDLNAVQIVDFFLKFNIHSFTAYFAKYYNNKYKLDLIRNDEFLDEWNKHMKDVLNPMYLEELKKLKEYIAGKGKIDTQTYIS